MTAPRDFEALVRHSMDLILAVDRENRLLYANPAAERFFGVDVGAHMGEVILDRVDPTQRDRVVARLAAIGTGVVNGSPHRYRVRDAVGEWHVIEAVAARAVDDPGLGEVVVNARDVTEECNLERALRTLTQGTRVLLRSSVERQLLREMCTAIVDTGGYLLAWVGMAETDDARTVRAVASAGQTGYLKNLFVSWSDDRHGRGPTGTAIRTGRTQVMEDMTSAAAFEPWRQRATSFGFRTSCVLPLRINSRVIGSLNIYAGEVGAFNASAVELLEQLADELSYGLARLRMRHHLELTRRQLDGSLRRAIRALGATVEVRDPYTAGHQRRVAELAGAVATELGLSRRDRDGIELAAAIHDVGKIAVPAEILNRPGIHSAVEHEIIKEHPLTGYAIVADIDFPWPIAEMIRQHHERLDGTGYPFGLRGDQIVLGARIIAVADVVEAMSAHRPYRPARGIDAALREISKHAGTAYDAKVADAVASLFKSKSFRFSDMP